MLYFSCDILVTSLIDAGVVVEFRPADEDGVTLIQSPNLGMLFFFLFLKLVFMVSCLISGSCNAPSA